MKTFLALFLSALSLCGQTLTGTGTISGSGQLANVASAAPSCTVSNGNLLNESFESTIGSWTQEGTISATWGDAMPGTSPCAGLGTKTLGCATTGDQTAFVSYDLDGNYGQDTRYYRFYVLVDSIGTDGNYYLFVEGALKASPSRQLLVWVNKSSSTYTLVFGASGGTYPSIGISLATWYRVEVQAVSGGLCSMKVFDATGAQVGSTVTSTMSSSIGSRYVNYGLIQKEQTGNCTAHIDGVGVSSTGWLGQ